MGDKKRQSVQTVLKLKKNRLPLLFTLQLSLAAVAANPIISFK